MRTVMNLAALGAMLALSVTPVQAEMLSNESIDLDLLVFVPCANEGAGEFVDLNGPLHTLVSLTISGKTISGKTHFQPQGISGVGLDTDERYHGTGVTQDHFKGSFKNGQFNQTFVNNFRIIGQGRGNNFLLHENFHLTVNASGEVNTIHDNFSVECK